MSKRSDVNGKLRRLRALRVALGDIRWTWRPLDRKGRVPFGIPKVLKTREQILQACHLWVLKRNVDQWWFAVERRAYDCYGRYSVITDHFEMLVYRETLWTGFRPSFQCEDRKAVCYG